MNNCLVTKYLVEAQNDNLPYFGKIELKLINPTDSSVSLHFNQSDNSLLKWSDGATGLLKVINGTALFGNGTSVANIEDSPAITLPANSESSVLCDNAYNIVSVDVRYYGSKESDLSIIKYNSIGSFIMQNTSDFDVEYLPDTITYINVTNSASHYLYGSIKDVRLPNIADDNSSVLVLTTHIEPFTLTDAINMLDKGNGLSSISNWADLIRYTDNNFLGGDVADIPKNVYYINFGPSTPLTCTLGRRNTSDCYILAVGGSNGSYLVSPTDVDNYLINNAACTLKSGGNTTIKLYCNESYTPSSNAQTAITTLKSKGITSIKVNNVEL